MIAIVFYDSSTYAVARANTHGSSEVAWLISRNGVVGQDPDEHVPSAVYLPGTSGACG